MIILCAQGTMAAAVAVLAFTTATETVTVPLILGTVFVLGAARAFEATTIQTLPPGIVPPPHCPRRSQDYLPPIRRRRSQGRRLAAFC